MFLCSLTARVSVPGTLVDDLGAKMEVGIEAGMVGYKVVGEGRDMVKLEQGWWMLMK